MRPPAFGSQWESSHWVHQGLAQVLKKCSWWEILIHILGNIP